jgi:hypothetical protein
MAKIPASGRQFDGRLARAGCKTYVILGVLTLCCPATSQEKQSVKIHAQYSAYVERVRPSPITATVSNDVTLILSGKNAIQETFNQQSAIFGQNANSNMSLGRSSGDARWHVVSPSKLIRINSWPQSQTFLTIAVHESTCTVSVDYRLRPGFTEYKFWDFQLSAWAFYSQAKFVGGTCVIETM